MKQNYYFRRILSAVLLLMVSTLVWAQDFAAENEDGVTIYYNLINDGTEAEVTYYDSQWSASYFDEVIMIPETVAYDGRTLRVTSIGDWAFYFCSSLTSVTIPNSVTSIDEYAFFGCSNLTSVTIPNSVISIGDWAFSDCSSLTSMTVDEGNLVYDSRDNCNAIIETASNTLVQGCLSTIIPSNVTSIGSSAFQNYNSLASVTIPNSVTSIDYRAFAGCSNLTSITIPNSVTSIGEWAFQYCSGLTSIIVDEGNPVYDSRNNCNAIIETTSNTLIWGCQSTVIPNSVTSIGSDAFDGCSGLTSIDIPNSVTRIGGGAFRNCGGLTSIDVPNSVTSIGDEAFRNCRNLTSITIPEGVTSIGSYTFAGCSSLTSIDIPNSMTTIGSDAFQYCI